MEWYKKKVGLGSGRAFCYFCFFSMLALAGAASFRSWKTYEKNKQSKKDYKDEFAKYERKVAFWSCVSDITLPVCTSDILKKHPIVNFSKVKKVRDLLSEDSSKRARTFNSIVKRNRQISPILKKILVTIAKKDVKSTYQAFRVYCSQEGSYGMVCDNLSSFKLAIFKKPYGFLPPNKPIIKPIFVGVFVAPIAFYAIFGFVLMIRFLTNFAVPSFEFGCFMLFLAPFFLPVWIIAGFVTVGVLTAKKVKARRQNTKKGQEDKKREAKKLAMLSVDEKRLTELSHILDVDVPIMEREREDLIAKIKIKEPPFR